MKKRTEECTEELFWECVQEINWPCDYDVAKAEMIRAWTPEFAKGFSKIFGDKISKVYKTWEHFEEHELSRRQRHEYYLSDDGLSDFTAHVVGMGKEIFEAEMADPMKLYERACKSAYKENFGYCIPEPPQFEGDTFEQWAEATGYRLGEGYWSPSPWDADRTYEEHLASIHEMYMESIRGGWRYTEADHYAKRWEFYLPPFEAFLEGLEHPSTDGEKSAVKFAGTMVRYITLIFEEKTQLALAVSGKAMQAWWGLYHILDVGDLRETQAALLAKPYRRECGGENYINDHRCYMGGLPRLKYQAHLKQLRAQAKKSA